MGALAQQSRESGASRVSAVIALYGLRQFCLYGECEISILRHDGDKVACHTFNLCCCSCLRETDTGNLKNPVFFARTNDDLICFHC